MSVDLTSMSRNELEELSRAIDRRMVELDQESRRQALTELFLPSELVRSE